MTACPISSLHKVLVRAQRRDPSVGPGPYLLSPDPIGKVVLDRSCRPLSSQLFNVAGYARSHVPAIILAVCKAILTSFTGAGKTLLSIISYFVLIIAFATQYLVEVLVCLEVGNFATFAHLQGGDVDCDCFKKNVCHFRKSFQISSLH